MRNTVSCELLQKFLVFHALCSDPRQWSEEALRDNPPRYYRYKQVMAMMRALGIVSMLKDFTEGKFLSEENLFPDEAKSSRYKEMFSEWQARYNLSEDSVDRRDLSLLFRLLLEYRMKAFSLENFWAGTLEAPSIIGRMAYPLTAVVNTTLRKSLSEIEELLCLLIDPLGRKLSPDELKEKFSYPDVDLREIDFENM